MKRSYRVNYPTSDIKGGVRIVNSPLRRIKKDLNMEYLFKYENFHDDYVILSWEEEIRPQNFLKIFGAYYSPDTEIFYANKSEKIAIPVVSLKALSKYLQYPINQNFTERVLLYKVTGSIDDLLAFDSKDTETDTFSLMVNLLQRVDVETITDKKEIKDRLLKFTDAMTRFLFTFGAFMEDFAQHVEEEEFKTIEYTFQKNTLLGVDSIDEFRKASLDYPSYFVEHEFTTSEFNLTNPLYKALNKEELSEYFIKTSPSLDVADKSIKDFLKPIQNKVSKRTLSLFDVADSKIEADAKQSKELYTTYYGEMSILYCKKFSVIFNKISKILLKEVS